MGKAVVANDEKEISNAVGALLRRFIAAIIIFFIPTIVSAIFNAVLGVNLSDSESGINLCVQCVTNVSGMGEQCTSDVEVNSGFGYVIDKIDNY